MSEWYVYRHRRLDTNEVFYIGIGSSENYTRAYDKIRRSNLWKNLTSKTEYDVEILIEGLSKEEATELEIFMISLYGRRDIKTGCLVNMTEGGETSKGKLLSETTKNKIGNANRGRKYSCEYLQTISRGKSHEAKLVLDTQTGIFFDCLKDAAESYNLNYHTLKGYMRGTRPNKTNLKYC